MKKQTISALLTAFMILLVMLIVILVIKISARGPKPVETAASDNTIVEENNSVSQDETSNTEEIPEERVLVAVPNTTSSVNVRSGPGTDYERLGSAYSNNEYEVLDVYSIGWTKLSYDDVEGFISNEYLMYSYRVTASDGNVSYESIDISEISLKEYAESGNIPDTTSDNNATAEE